MASATPQRRRPAGMSFEQMEAANRARLRRGYEQLTPAGGRAGDRALAAARDDRLKGNDGFDVVKGQNGKDKLNGSRGRDGVRGNNGKDCLKGGNGRDVINGDRA